MLTPPSTKPASRGPNWVSLLFAALAVILFVVAILLARPLLFPTPILAPTAVAGGLQAVHVTDALTAQGLIVEQNQGFVPRGVFSVPGQGVAVNQIPMFIFIFPDAATATAEMAAADPALIGPRGTPIPGEVPSFLGKDNVVVALYTGPAAVRDGVEQALAGLR